jgi:hypothetical protein
LETKRVLVPIYGSYAELAEARDDAVYAGGETLRVGESFRKKTLLVQVEIKS